MQMCKLGNSDLAVSAIAVGYVGLGIAEGIAI
jgi:aryl-alcohol dehydrogenase-like predicted oxidoreductase